MVKKFELWLDRLAEPSRNRVVVLARQATPQAADWRPPTPYAL